MAKKLLEQDEFYILPQDFRIGCLISLPCAVAAVFGFSLFMLWLGIRQDTDKIPCFVVSCISAGLAAWLFITGIQGLSVVNATYRMDHACAINNSKQFPAPIMVDLENARMFDFEKKGRFHFKFTIVTTTMTESDIKALDESDLYGTIKEIWAFQSVVIPKTGKGTLEH